MSQGMPADSMASNSDGVAPGNAALAKWVTDHTFGMKIRVEIKDMKEPGEMWRARTVDKDHVETLKASFKKLGTKNTNMVLAVQDDALYREWSGWQAQNPGTAMPVEEQRRWIDTKFIDGGVCPSGMQTAAGNHSRNAQLKLILQYPHGARWKYNEVQVLLCPSDRDSDEQLRVMSVWDNVAAGV